MPKMIIKASGVPLINKNEAGEIASSIGASSYSSKHTETFSQYDMVFRFDDLDSGNEALQMLGDDNEAYVEYSDGTIGRHYVRYERNNADD